MKVKVGDTVYDSNEQPVMVILTEQDKENIRNMHPECTQYAVAPDDAFDTDDDFLEWMEEVDAMTTIQFDDNDTPDIIAGRVSEALRTYKAAGGDTPVELLVHPDDFERVKSDAVGRVLAGNARLSSSESVPKRTIRIKPKGKVTL